MRYYVIIMIQSSNYDMKCKHFELLVNYERKIMTQRSELLNTNNEIMRH